MMEKLNPNMIDIDLFFKVAYIPHNSVRLRFERSSKRTWAMRTSKKKLLYMCVFIIATYKVMQVENDSCEPNKMNESLTYQFQVVKSRR